MTHFGMHAHRPRRRRELAATFVALLVLVAPLLTATPAAAVGADDPASPVRAYEIQIQPGTEIQQVVDAHPPGTTFRLMAGVHRAQQITPRNGDVFKGQNGTVLDGTIVIDSSRFVASGRGWVQNGRTEEPFRDPSGGLHGRMDAGHEREAANHDLWVDGVRWRHVNTRGEADSEGEWFFDYDRDHLVLGANPAGRLVELSVAQHAFRSDANRVQIRYMTVRRYANPAQHGAIQADGNHWWMRHMDLVENHGPGVRLGNYSILKDNLIAHNGQIGISAMHTVGVSVVRNEVVGNGTLGYRWSWEGGAMKFQDTDGTVFRHNLVTGNKGYGIWFDTDNINARIYGNTVENNSLGGILYEISYTADIHHNTIRNNGADGWGDLGAGVWVSISSDVTVRDNIIHDNRVAVLATHYSREDDPTGQFRLENLSVHGNDMTTDVVPSGLRVYTNETWLYSSDHQEWYGNTYRVTPGRALVWWQGDQTLESFQAKGFAEGAVIR